MGCACHTRSDQAEGTATTSAGHHRFLTRKLEKVADLTKTWLYYIMNSAEREAYQVTQTESASLKRCNCILMQLYFDATKVANRNLKTRSLEQ
jgi:hypothetical protein